MDGRLLRHPGATAVSARYFGAVTSEHLDRLAGLAGAERERFARRWPRTATASSQPRWPRARRCTC